MLQLLESTIILLLSVLLDSLLRSGIGISGSPLRSRLQCGRDVHSLPGVVLKEHRVSGIEELQQRDCFGVPTIESYAAFDGTTVFPRPATEGDG